MLDLFCGAGGFSLGFERAGFEIVGGIESDPRAAETHAKNFRLERVDVGQETSGHHLDIRRVDPAGWARAAGLGDPEMAVDIVIGGPPCPAFTRVGRAKLREIAKHPEAYRNDPRATLYRPYLEWVRTLGPLAVVMENVPDVLNWGGRNLAEEICEYLEVELDYRCSYTLLNAASYSVPQMRPRFFLVAVHTACRRDFGFPAPTHRPDLPVGYGMARLAALRPLRTNGGAARSRYVEVRATGGELPPAVTAAAALADLPRISPVPGGADRYGPSGESPSPWVRTEMRRWPGRSLDEGAPVGQHTIRQLTARDFRLFAAMQPGEQYREAYQHALKLFETGLDALESRVALPEASTDAERMARSLDRARRWLHERPAPDPAEVAEGFVRRLGRMRRTVASLERSHAVARMELANLAEGRFGVTGLQADSLAPRFELAEQIATHIRDSKPGDRAPVGRGDVGRLFNGVWRESRRRSAWLKAVEHFETDTRDLFATGGDGLALKRGPAWGLELAWTRPELQRRLNQVAAGLGLADPGEADNGPAEWRTLLFDVLLVHVSQGIDLFSALKAEFVPPYLPDKFPNKWRKMAPDEPARTLMAHLGKDSYSHIHYDSSQARTISVREAARLQSFPDSFVFEGSMNTAFRQIGNAVPPLLAWRLADALRLTLAAGASVARRSTDDVQASVTVSP